MLMLFYSPLFCLGNHHFLSRFLLALVPGSISETSVFSYYYLTSFYAFTPHTDWIDLYRTDTNFIFTSTSSFLPCGPLSEPTELLTPITEVLQPSHIGSFMLLEQSSNNRNVHLWYLWSLKTSISNFFLSSPTINPPPLSHPQRVTLSSIHVLKCASFI